MTTRIPESISHDDFLEATRPLLDLLGVSQDEVYPNLRMSPAPRGSHALGLIEVTVVAREKGDESDYPSGLQLEDPPQEFAELSYTCEIEVL